MDARHKGEHDAIWLAIVFMGSGRRPSARHGMTAWFRAARDAGCPPKPIAD